ncbi:MAG: hypothetical protein LKK13_01190 [Bacilli bacterium]|jgi:hypothetical protein|nr:hypothetical protein [Bacilli bacterium]
MMDSVDSVWQNNIGAVPRKILIGQTENIANRLFAFLWIKGRAVIENRSQASFAPFRQNSPIAIIAIVVCQETIDDYLIPKAG